MSFDQSTQASGIWSTLGSGSTLPTSSGFRSSSGSLGSTLRELANQVDHIQALSRPEKSDQNLLLQSASQQDGRGSEDHGLQELLSTLNQKLQKMDSTTSADSLSLDDVKLLIANKVEELKLVSNEKSPNSSYTDRLLEGRKLSMDAPSQNNTLHSNEVPEAQIQAEIIEKELDSKNTYSKISQVQSIPTFQRTISAPSIQMQADSTREAIEPQSTRPQPHARTTLPLPRKNNSWMQKLSSMSLKAKSRVELLCKSSEEGELASAKALIEAGADIDGSGQNGYTPLGIAVKAGGIEMASLLLQYGADVNNGWKAKSMKEYNRQNKNDIRNPIHLAAEAGSAELVDLLVRHGANVNDTSGCVLGRKRRLPLHFACNREVMMRLLDQGASAFSAIAEHPDDQPPLSEAILRERVSCVEALLEHDASVDATDPGKARALFQACRLAGSANSLAIITLLIAHGASMKPLVLGGSTKKPLSALCSRRRALNQYDIDGVRALIDAGAGHDQDARNDALCELCNYFRFQDVETRYKVLQLLINIGADAEGAKALYKICAVFIFWDEKEPGEEDLIKQFLKLSLPLIKTGASAEGLVSRIKTVQSIFGRGELPFPEQFGEFWLGSEAQFDQLCFLNNKHAAKRMEVCLTFINWIQWAKSNFGLEVLEQHVEDFWGTLSKTGISPRKAPSEINESNKGPSGRDNG